jgi:hypothetical protein
MVKLDFSKKKNQYNIQNGTEGVYLNYLFFFGLTHYTGVYAKSVEWYESPRVQCNPPIRFSKTLRQAAIQIIAKDSTKFKKLRIRMV